MNRRTFLCQATAASALAVGYTALGRHASFAQEAKPAARLGALGLPEVTVKVDDNGFAIPIGTTAGRLLMTVENTGTQPLHFFAIRVPDQVSDGQLAEDLASAAGEPSWFDMAKLPMLGNPDWPSPGGRAQGVVDVAAGRWVLADPIGGRDVALWTVGEGSGNDSAQEPPADVEIGLIEMDFSGLEQPVAAGPSVWKISNQGALEHELALLPVSSGSTNDDVIQMISDMLQGKGDPDQFAPVGGQGIASKGVTSWQQFDLSPKTVAKHVSNIFAKLQVADRAEAIVRARDAGLG
jgi:hypothetical protein